MDINSQMRAAAEQQYNPLKGWKESAQPLRGLAASDYHEISLEALPVFRQKLIETLDNEKLSYIELSPEDLLEFESSDLLFRPWLAEHCTKTGKNINADVLLVAGVKALASCERKVAFNPTAADREHDYLRALLVPLNKKGETSKARLQKIGNMIGNMENDERTVGRKNQFWAPSETGYRGHKSLWSIPVAEEGALSGIGLEILAEIKIEAENHMDAHKLTRRYLGLSRSTDASLAIYFDRCAGEEDDQKESKVIFANMGRITKSKAELVQLSKVLYNVLYQDDGYDRFLNPAIKDKHMALPMTAIRPMVRELVTALGPKVEADLERSGFLAGKRAKEYGPLRNDLVSHMA